MPEQFDESRRVVRPLTDEETARLAEARREVEAEREQIVRAGREAKARINASRRDAGECGGNR